MGFLLGCPRNLTALNDGGLSDCTRDILTLSGTQLASISNIISLRVGVMIIHKQNNGDPGGIRTREPTVKGWCLNHLTTGPLLTIYFIIHWCKTLDTVMNYNTQQLFSSIYLFNIDVSTVSCN